MSAMPPVPPAPPGAPPPQFGGHGGPPAGPRVAARLAGYLLAIGGVVAGAGTFFTYEKLSNLGGSYSFTGVGSETATGSAKQAVDALEPGSAGKVILAVGVVGVVLGVLVILGLGRLWVGIVGIVVGAVGLVLAAAAFAAPGSDADKLGNVTGSAEIGVYLGLLGTALMLVGGIVAVVRRPRVTA